LGSFLKITEEPQLFGLRLKLRLRLCINFDKNVLGYILGDTFQEFIWSPCFQQNKRKKAKLFAEITLFRRGLRAKESHFLLRRRFQKYFARKKLPQCLETDGFGTKVLPILFEKYVRISALKRSVSFSLDFQK
jgi:hypothetical protein